MMLAFSGFAAEPAGVLFEQLETGRVRGAGRQAGQRRNQCFQGHRSSIHGFCLLAL